jgi:acyl-CoA reductase-like NAD-dependent aldehyde dehydrogenase
MGSLLFTNTSKINNSSILTQNNPSSHADVIAKYSNASPADVKKAIDAALAAKPAWEALPFNERASVFLKAADLISTKYRYEIMAATMLGQGKNAWQAEIDSAAELCDFLRFNVKYAEDTYGHQPTHNSPGVWKYVQVPDYSWETKLTSAVALSTDPSKVSYTPSPHSTSQLLAATFPPRRP